MELIDAPNEIEFKEIIFWLYQEWKKVGSGFYSNRNIIEKAYEEEKILIFIKDNSPIGFLIWTEQRENAQFCIALDIMAIHPDYRGQGIGEEFYGRAENYFYKKGAIAIKLFCSPVESEPFWKAMMFRKYPDTGCTEHPLTYYKPLIEQSKVSRESVPNRLELWDVSHYKASQFEPAWTWRINSKFKNVIQPCNSDWNLRLTLNNKTVKEDKVKYFTSKYHELEVGSFLFINRQKLDSIIREL